jgi:hypothetical protein
MIQGSQAELAGGAVDLDGRSIDLTGFVIRHRALFVLSTIIAALMTAGGYAIAQAVPGSTTVRYRITLTFKGAAQGEYPNQTPFSPQDIIGADVLEPLWRVQGLQQRLSLEELARLITISRESREFSLLQFEYEQKLANAKLNTAERQILETEYKAKLDALAQTGFVISCGAGPLTVAEAEQLITAIPAEWARLSEASGVTAYEFPLPQSKDLRNSADVLLQNDADIVALILHAELLREYTESVSETIRKLMTVQGSELVKASRGETLLDVRQRVLALQRNLILPVYIDTMAMAQERSNSEYVSITGVRRQMLQASLSESEQRSRVLHDALGQLSSDRRESQSSESTSSEGGVLANVDGTFIDRVIDQAVKSKDVAYRRELIERVVEADLEVAEQKARVEFETWLMKAVQERRDASAQIQSSTSLTTERLVSLSQQIAELSDRTREILLGVANRNLNPASSLFKGDIAPVVVTERPLPTRNLAVAGVGLWFALLGLAALVGVAQNRRGVLA